MEKLSHFVVAVCAALLLSVPSLASAQQPAAQQGNVPETVQDVESTVERAVQRFGIGLQAGMAVDPELIMLGAHGRFGPLFHSDVHFRPGIEFGFGEVTTLFGINLDFLYAFSNDQEGRWTAYLGGGPNFALSHESFEAESEDGEEDGEDSDRFDFSDTDFEGGFNFIAGARREGGLFIEMRATAYGVSNVKLIVGYNF